MKKLFTYHLILIFLTGMITSFTYYDSYASDEQDNIDENEILNAFLKNAVKKAKKNIEAKGRIETEDVIPFMLKFQYNDIAHLKEDIAHLRKEMVTKTEFNAFKQSMEMRFGVLDSRIDNLGSRVDFLQWIMLFGIAMMGIGFVVLGIMQGYAIKRKN